MQTRPDSNSNTDHDNRWIEAESADVFTHRSNESISSLGDLFSDPDPYQTFTRVYHTTEVISDMVSSSSSINNTSNGIGSVDNADDITIVLKGFKAENGQTLDSTGMTLWRASGILCRYLIAHREELLSNHIVLELGAGLGECGILAYKLELARRVIMSDGDTDVLEQMRKNVDYNLQIPGGSTMVLPCRQVIWQKNVEDFRQRWCVREQNIDGFDIIMGADIIYTETAIEPLFDTVTSLLSKNNPKAKFLLAYARRNVKVDMVLEHAKKCGLQWYEPDDAEGVYVFSWNKQ